MFGECSREGRREVISSCLGWWGTSWDSGHSGCCIRCSRRGESIVQEVLRWRQVRDYIHAALRNCRKSAETESMRMRTTAKRTEGVERRVRLLKGPYREIGCCCRCRMGNCAILGKAAESEAKDLLAEKMCRSIGVDETGRKGVG